ncbi:sugar ABC transporter ATP-binding protein [Roseovarius sp.]|uniref:sugar ABC transporter ATP-binding protein n=1 Tax=Roseovarius sp. TaxID=1486281 RepID=UPI003567486B
MSQQSGSASAVTGRDKRPVTPLLEAHALRKSFFGVTVLEGVSLALQAGEVRALLGENGAGKSTIINLLSGVLPLDGGEIRLDGQAVDFKSPLAADLAGISVIRQELSLFPDLTVAEAVFAGHLPTTRLGRIDWQHMQTATASALQRLGADIDPNAEVVTLSIGEQQLVEITRALTRQARIVIMDEPTASLSPREVERLIEIVRALSAQGVAILYVSHRLDEVREICDTYTVLRDGIAISEGDIGASDNAQLIRDMAGRPVEIGRTSAVRQRGAPVLEVRHLKAPPAGRVGRKVRDVSFSLHAHEILGLAGIIGAGRTETARMIFGLDPIEDGEILLDGVPFRPGTPADAIRAGLGYVSEDRKELSIFPDLSVVENFAMTGAVPPRAVWQNDRPGEMRLLRDFVDRLGIRAASLRAPVTNLSGGNQQKVMLARWIARKPRVLIVDEPTRGIDIGAKEDVHDLIRAVAADGVGVLLISSDMSEVLALSDRILAIREGVVSMDLDAADATAEGLMTQMTYQA